MIEKKTACLQFFLFVFFFYIITYYTYFMTTWTTDKNPGIFGEQHFFFFEVEKNLLVTVTNV